MGFVLKCVKGIGSRDSASVFGLLPTPSSDSEATSTGCRYDLPLVPTGRMRAWRCRCGALGHFHGSVILVFRFFFHSLQNNSWVAGSQGSAFASESCCQLVLLLGEAQYWNHPPWPGTIVTICMSCFTTGDSGKESESESEVPQSCLTLCDPVDCSPPGSSVHGILQARILQWVAISGTGN